MDLNHQQSTDRQYMRRCIQLATLGAGSVAPNPMVGSVLVYQSRIIGEGYHQQYGRAHAEVNCINSVKDEDVQYIPDSVLYVSLEPCAHFGKTPPCADLIIRHRIPVVVIGCRDPFDQVNGKGIDKLLAAGIEVRTGILEQECKELNKRFFTFHLKKRPYIILKWAQTADHFIAGSPGSERLMITNDHSNRMVHKWRSEEAAIMVGRKTVQADNPSLTNRYWTGNSPMRLIIDPFLSLDPASIVFDQTVPTMVFHQMEKDPAAFISSLPASSTSLRFKAVSKEHFMEDVMTSLYDSTINSVLVEGGATLMKWFVNTGTWDEARIITNRSLRAGTGLAAPVLPFYNQLSEESSGSDLTAIFINQPC